MIRELSKRCDCPRARWPKCDHGFHYRKMVNGRRWKISLDQWLGHARVRSVGQAEQTAAEILALLRAGTFSPLGPASPDGALVVARATGQGHTVASVAATYRAIVDADPERKPKYKSGLKAMVSVVTGWRIPERAETLGDLPIGAVDTALLERFYKTQVAAGKAASYRTKMIQFFRHFSRWAVREGYLTVAWLNPDDPRVTIKRRKSAQRHRRLALPLTDAAGRLLVAGEYARLLAVAEPRLRDLCLATMETGARLAELTTLRWCEVDLPRGTLTIWDTKDPDGVKKRVLPISATLRQVLEGRQWQPDGTRHGPTAWVFGNAFGERVASLATAWENAVLRAHGHAVTRDPQTHGLSAAARAAYRAIDLTFHDLRHEAASQWLEGGVPLPTISFLLGHTSLETTSIYLNVRPDGLAATMAAFERARTEAARQSGPPVAHHATSARPRPLTMVPRKSRKAQESKDLA